MITPGLKILTISLMPAMATELRLEGASVAHELHWQVWEISILRDNAHHHISSGIKVRGGNTAQASSDLLLKAALL